MNSNSIEVLSYCSFVFVFVDEVHLLIFESKVLRLIYETFFFFFDEVHFLIFISKVPRLMHETFC